MANGQPFREVSQQEFLATVREALGATGVRSEPPMHPEMRLDDERHRQKTEEIRSRLASRRAELVRHMAHMAQVQNWRVQEVPDDDAALRHIFAVVEELGARRIALTEHLALQRLSLPERLREAGLSVVVASQSHGQSREGIRDLLAESDLGITGADYALAETGSCIVLPRQGVSRLVSLLPPVHLAIVDASQIVETLDDLMALRRLSFIEDGRLNSYMSIISGPSRTGDIEQTIVIGVHGPRQVYMLIIDNGSG